MVAFFNISGLSFIPKLNKFDFEELEALEELEELEENLTEENIEEVCKIFWAFYVLNYKGDEKLQNILQNYLNNDG